VDFSRHDGIGTVICGALSSGLLGNAYHHSDIGGYTSLFGNVRTPDLLQRWSEMAAFTPVMRSHEGNRPALNLQIDQDPVVLAHFARMTRIYVHLAPYLAELSAQACCRGLPLQRPLFLHHEDDPRTYAIQDQYLYGEQMLIAPVLEEGAKDRKVYLPAGTAWTHVWTGRSYEGGTDVTVSAPLGQPPAFYKDGASFQALFDGLRLL
jgi:alpha-glucosidase